MGIHDNAFFILAIVAILGVTLTGCMKYFVDARKASSESAGADAYRELAQKFAAAQTASAASLAALQADFVELKTRLASIETVLRQVE
jgi:Tfp pilus assembly protein PilO